MLIMIMIIMTNIINNYNYIIIQQHFHSGSCSYCTYLYKLYTENCKYFDQFASLSLSNNIIMIVVVIVIVIVIMSFFFPLILLMQKLFFFTFMTLSFSVL